MHWSVLLSFSWNVLNGIYIFTRLFFSGMVRRGLSFVLLLLGGKVVGNLDPDVIGMSGRDGVLVEMDRGSIELRVVLERDGAVGMGIQLTHGQVG